MQGACYRHTLPSMEMPSFQYESICSSRNLVGQSTVPESLVEAFGASVLPDKSTRPHVRHTWTNPAVFLHQLCLHITAAVVSTFKGENRASLTKGTL